MTERKIWVGSVGPLLYDDTDLIGDEDGDLPSSTHSAIVTTGQMIVNQAPSVNGNVLRMQDVSSAAYKTYTELLTTIPVNGFTVALNANVRFIRIGDLCCAIFTPVTGTSNAVTFTLDPLPASMIPQSQILMPIAATDNGVPGLRYVLLTGASTLVSLRMTPTVANTWTASGTKGYNGFSLMYRGI